MNEDLLKEIKSTIPWLLVAAIAVGGYYWVKDHIAEKKAAASEAVVSAYTTDELEEAVSKFSGTASVGALKLRLAKSYYDAARFDEALDTYTALEGNAPDGFADIPALGKAMCLEALGKFDDAAAAFDAYYEANPNGYLTLTAQLGAARAYSQAGDKTKALARLDSIKAANKDNELALARVDATIDLVKRYEKRAEVSLFDAADAAAASLEAEAEKAE